MYLLIDTYPVHFAIYCWDSPTQTNTKQFLTKMDFLFRHNFGNSLRQSNSQSIRQCIISSGTNHRRPAMITSPRPFPPTGPPQMYILNCSHPKNRHSFIFIRSYGLFPYFLFFISLLLHVSQISSFYPLNFSLSFILSLNFLLFYKRGSVRRANYTSGDCLDVFPTTSIYQKEVHYLTRCFL